MRRGTRIGVVVAVLVVVFAGGWAGGAAWGIYRVSKFDRAHLVSNLWLDQISSLTAHFNGKLLDANAVPIVVGSALDGESLLLSYIYDDLPPQQKDTILQYLKAAHNVAVTQAGPGLMRDRRHLKIFVQCVKQVRAKGGSVRACATKHKMYNLPPHRGDEETSGFPVPAPAVSTSSGHRGTLRDGTKKSTESTESTGSGPAS